MANSGLQAGPATRVVLRCIVYYAVLIGAAVLAWPYLPHTGGLPSFAIDAMLGLPSPTSKHEPITLDGMSLAGGVAIAMLASVLLALPVAWVYLVTRAKRGYQQSVVQLLVILPAVVAGIVLLVQYSLALAFSLAGIVAAVRFRTTLDDSKDAVYIFLATAVGLAAGVQLPMAAVLSVVFNLIMLALWYTEFGKVPPALEGVVAERRLEEARERLRQTGSFVAMLDDEIFADMTPEQLDLTADRAWRRRRRLDSDEMSDEEMQKRDALLRVRTRNAEEARPAIEAVLDGFCKKFRFGGILKEADGIQVIEYAIQLKKSARG